ncbi:MAG: glycosyl hydrolase family 28-related protein, partial [Planctomycetota bacterium]
MTRGGSFILAAGAIVWLLIASATCGQTGPKGPVSVRDFDAVGDGKTDDSGAFQRAIDSGRGDIRVPRGTYRFTKTVVAHLDRIGPLSIKGS